MASTTTRQPRKPKPKPKPADVCRLTLHIRGVGYSVAPLPTEDPDDLRAFRLRRAGADAHVIVLNVRTGLECDCGDYTWRHAGRGSLCKHLRAALAVGLVEDPFADRRPRPRA